MVGVCFADYSIVAGVRVTAKYSRKDGYYPKAFKGKVETVYPVFAVVRTAAGYRVTIHLSDLICSFVHVHIHVKTAAVRVTAAVVPWRKERRHENKTLVSAAVL
jgi:hypothetical protein